MSLNVFITKVWFKNNKLGILLWPIFMPLSCIFWLISKLRRYKYLHCKSCSYKAKVPVVIVGNITVGGSGKTPVVLYLTEQLQNLGYKVGVVSRGYKSKAPYYPFEVTTDTPAEICGDEPLLIKLRSDAKVVIAPSRRKAVAMLEKQGVDIIISDDGMQHYALERDIELLIIDGQRRFGNQKLLPLGPLRETMNRCLSVDYKIANGGIAHPGEISMHLQPINAVNFVSGEKCPVHKLSHSRKIAAMAGIGAPERFFNMLNKLGLNLGYIQPLADHTTIEYHKLIKILVQYNVLLITEKDMVKMVDFIADYPDEILLQRIWYVPVDAVFATSDIKPVLDKIVSKIEAK